MLDSPVRHGGNLIEAIRRYGGEHGDWLDLSTGISPWSYPIPEIPKRIWHDLPCPSNELVKSAALYYGCSEKSITVTPGSQLAIRLLPRLIESKQSVAIPHIGYQEHHYAWQGSGHKILLYSNIEELEYLTSVGKVDNAVVINPNNPSGETASINELKAIAQRLSGLLIVDEAFMDAQPQLSMLNERLEPNVLIMRSLGKFFGLAGARIGFLIGLDPLNLSLRALLNPWALSGPSQYIAEQALNDIEWQIQQNARLSQQQERMKNCLNSFLARHTNQEAQLTATGLFNTIFSGAEFIERVHTQLAEAKIWSRIGDAENERNWIRLSLPDQENLKRLRDNMGRITAHNV